MSPIRLTQATALILRALATGHHHGFEIMEVSGLPSGTVYPVLRRLERELAVESEWEGEAVAHDAGRPRRRVYRLTESGQQWAERARQRLAETARLMADPNLAGVPASGGDAS